MMQWAGYIFTRGLTELFRFVPFSVLYVLSDGLAFLLYHVVCYRRKVVMDNLRRCYPEKTERELTAIARESYRNLSDIILESVKGTTTSLKEMKKRYRYRNYEIVNKALDSGQSVVIAGGHYNNWEWGVITIGAGFRGKTIGVYKPLSNKLTDNWFFKNRSRDGFMILKSMKDTYKSVVAYKGIPAVFLLMADQVPSNRKTAIAVDFFGQRTACLPGTEAIAKSNNYPVFMYDIQRLKRGYYEMSFSEVWPEPATAADGEITQRFMSMLEDIIRKNPSSWLWSHKRWKWQP